MTWNSKCCLHFILPFRGQSNTAKENVREVGKRDLCPPSRKAVQPSVEIKPEPPKTYAEQRISSPMKIAMMNLGKFIRIVPAT